jgi:hypothetical protein
MVRDPPSSGGHLGQLGNKMVRQHARVLQLAGRSPGGDVCCLFPYDTRGVSEMRRRSVGRSFGRSCAVRGPVANGNQTVFGCGRHGDRNAV